MRGSLGRPAEEKAIAGIHDGDVLVAGHEGEWGADQGRLACLAEIGESPHFATVVDVAQEEAGDGLEKPPAVVGVGDEIAPVRGDALAAAQRLYGQPREDIDDEVIGEAGRRRVRHLLPGLLHRSRDLLNFSDGGERLQDATDEIHDGNGRLDEGVLPTLFSDGGRGSDSHSVVL